MNAKEDFDMDKTICELFAGVGGFRLGFEKLNSDGRLHGFHSGNRGRKHNGHMSVMCHISVILKI